MINMKHILERIFFPKVYRRRMRIKQLRSMSPLWRKYRKNLGKMMLEWIPKIYDSSRNIILDDMLNK
jgi:hypothetical protein